MILSFVILSYNQKEDVERCINSINFSGIPKNEYEIIILDDGSSDSSVEYLKGSENAIVIPFRKNTRNQSLLRNIGIGVAKGKYIMFADGDDYYNSVELGKLYGQFHDKEFDLYTSSMLQFYKEDKRLFLSNISAEMIEEPYREIDHGTQMYIVSRKFIIDESLWFDELKYNWDSEDMYFSYRLIDRAKNIIYNNSSKFVYLHLLYDGNNTSTKYKKATYYDYVNELYEDLIKEVDNENIKELLDIYMLSEIQRIFKGGLNV